MDVALKAAVPPEPARFGFDAPKVFEPGMSIERPDQVPTPFTAVTAVVPVMEPVPEATLIVSVAVESVPVRTRFEFASRISTEGCVESVTPAVPFEG